jgi:N-acetylglucosaminyldiphosphoundecaprenol N-acetyl-beta-D-mannosaminyltransferase
MPDGKPSQIVGNLKGHKKVKTVSGFHLCNALLTTSLTHYFYGANKEVLMKIKNNLNSSFPNATILGFKEAPFVDENQIKNNLQIKKDIDHINSLKPDLIWIGLSSPKQDYLMHYFYHDFNKSLLLGVGGVFLYLSDEKMKSPEWVKKIGFRWLYRLAKEPARLGPKVFRTLKFLFSNFFYFTSLLSTFLKKTITQKNAN